MVEIEPRQSASSCIRAAKRSDLFPLLLAQFKGPVILILLDRGVMGRGPGEMCGLGEVEMSSPPRGRGPLALIAAALLLRPPRLGAAPDGDSEARVRLQDRRIRAG
jgi:hypothetical protein